jgi:hypothetical protein
MFNEGTFRGAADIFCFAESAVKGVVYLDMLEQYGLPILEEEGPNDMPCQ